MTFRVSIVIPSLNAPTIEATLQSLYRQTAALSIAEILVVGLDNQQLIQAHPLLKWISTQRPVSAAVARNIGIRCAKSDWIAFIDADCIAAADWLEQLIAAATSQHLIIGGSVIIASPNQWTFADNLAMFHSLVPSLPATTRTALPTLNLLIARSVIDHVGLLDERFMGAAGEDFDWTLRMHQSGYTLQFAPRAQIHHRPARGNLASLMVHSWKSGYNMNIVRQRYATYYPASKIFQYPFLLQALAPLIGLITAVKIVARANLGRRSIHVLPKIWLAKTAWCLGAALQAAIIARSGKKPDSTI
ncbi:MAG: glycosyltransferase [Herpetosiphonaceae bacterium]|nr:glycosyltransferase [Herpetosiphonaceae bacterium]